MQSNSNLHRGLAEHSHRSGIATGILNDLKTNLSNFLDIPSSYEILLMQGIVDPRIFKMNKANELKVEDPGSLTPRYITSSLSGSRDNDRRS